MRCYKIDGLNITANSEEEAKAISRLAFIKHTEDRRIIIVKDDGSVESLLVNDSCIVYTQNKKNVTRVGRLDFDDGDKLIQAAVRSIDDSHAASAKIRANTRRNARLAKESEYDDIIEAFEGLVPENAKLVYAAVVDELCKGNKAYRIEMYQEINANITIVPENWIRIIAWFRANVLDGEGDATQYAKRKAFVTTVCRMGAEEYRVGNAVEQVAENDQEFWDRYAEDIRGSERDS